MKKTIEQYDDIVFEPNQKIWANILANEIQQEINRELIRQLYKDVNEKGIDAGSPLMNTMINVIYKDDWEK